MRVGNIGDSLSALVPSLVSEHQKKHVFTFLFTFISGLVRQLAMGSEIRFLVDFYISESRTNRRLTFCAGTKFSVSASKNTCV